MPEGLSLTTERLWTDFLSVAPLRAYTRIVRHLASIPVPPALRSAVLGGLAERMGMDLSEAEFPIEHYQSLGQLFTRHLKSGARPMASDDRALVSPVDGAVSAVGRLEGETLFQAKGLTYSAGELLGDDALAESLRGGTFVTLYLRPRDYHRIHAPLGGRLRRCRRIPGALFPVQPSSVRNVPGLFVRNERVVLEMETEAGPLGLIFVGAAAVGAISTPFEDGSRGLVEFEPALAIERGAEVGLFNLGSTVIVVAARGAVSLSPLATGDEVRVGMPLGKLRGNGLGGAS